MVLHTAARAGFLYSTAGLQLDEELAQAKYAKEQRFVFTTSARFAASNERYLAMIYVEPWWRPRAAQRTPLEVAQRSLCLGVASIGHESSCSQPPSLAELPGDIWLKCLSSCAPGCLTPMTNFERRWSLANQTKSNDCLM